MSVKQINHLLNRIPRHIFYSCIINLNLMNKEFKNINMQIQHKIYKKKTIFFLNQRFLNGWGAITPREVNR